MVPGYELLESLGRGGMGEVFLARQKSLGREVALKILRGDLAESGWLPERFEREARTMATLHHPNIVTVHDALRLSDGCVAIVMEFVRGGTLRARIAAAPEGLPLADAVRWVRQTADGLRAAHAAGIIHRDVKPENVLINTNGDARVSDFGISFSTGPEATRYTQTGTSLGTIGYMAPEQFRGGPVDERSDIYSLGAMFYEMLTGRLPQGSFSPARKLRPGIPEHLDAVIHACLRPDPQERPSNVSALLDMLAAAPARTLRITRRHALAVAAISGTAGLGWWLGHRGPKEPQPKSSKGPGPEWAPVPLPANPQSVAISGGWSLNAGALVSDERICILPIAAELPDAWSVRTKFRRLTGVFSVEIFFRTPNGTASFTLAAWVKGLGGVQVVDGVTIADSDSFLQWLENDRLYEWTVEYRSGLTRIWLDGRLRQERDIRGKALTVADPWEWTPGADSPALMLGSWKSATRFESVEWRSL